MEFENKNIAECKSQGYTRSAECHSEEDVKTSAKRTQAGDTGRMDDGACLERDVERKTKDESRHWDFAEDRGGWKRCEGRDGMCWFF